MTETVSHNLRVSSTEREVSIWQAHGFGMSLPRFVLPRLIAALQRVAGEGPVDQVRPSLGQVTPSVGQEPPPAPAPADDGWVTCEAGECPLDLKVGDWIRWSLGDAIIVRVDPSDRQNPYKCQPAGWVPRFVIDAYRRSAP